MSDPVFDFYDKTTLKSYNLDSTMRYQLNLLDSLDVFTRKHCENVANLTCRICKYLNCSNKFIVYCTICAYLHDLGKLFIPSNILQKSDRLTPEEYEIMKTHTTIGYNMCMKDLKLRPYAKGALYHHECLDGSGYPNGLTKKDIPIEAQIIKVADEYDAIVSKRQYKSHVNISDTLQILLDESKPIKPNKYGKVNPKILKCLFKVVIDDVEYEIYCVSEYTEYLEQEIARLELIDKFYIEMKNAKSEKKVQFYKNGIDENLKKGETLENYSNVLSEYKVALDIRKKHIDELNNEIKIIKKMKHKI